MEVIQLFVTANGVHIGEETLADIELVTLERKTLPLGKRVHDLCVDADVGNIEGDGALNAVEVVVQTGVFIHEQRSGNPAKIEGIAQIHLEIALDEFNGALHFINRQRGVVVLRDHDVAHTGFTPYKKYAFIIISHIKKHNSEILSS